MHICRCTGYCMNIPTACINTGMYLHSEVPFIALLCLMHFRITLAILVFSGFRCCYKAGVNNSATMHHKACFVETIVDISKNLLTKFICFKHMSELKQCSCIRYLLFIEIYMHKWTHGVTVVDRILDSFIGQIKPNLHEIHAKHGFNTNRFATALVSEIIWANHFYPIWPWDDFFHGIKKFLTLGFLLAVGVFHVGKC